MHYCVLLYARIILVFPRAICRELLQEQSGRGCQRLQHTLSCCVNVLWYAHQEIYCSVDRTLLP